MFTEEQRKWAVGRALAYLDRAGIVVTDEERARIEVVHEGLHRLEEIGLQMLTYVNTERVCAKEIILFPWQICPEHMHPPVNGRPGKEETFRVRFGEMYLYTPGDPTPNPKARVPEDKRDAFVHWHETILRPGDQFTLMPETWHWFQAGPDGVIVSEFSTTSFDEYDLFTDQEIDRLAGL